MSNIAVSVENLGKSYVLGHLAHDSKSLFSNLRSFLRKTRGMFRGEALVSGDKLEEFWALKNISFEVGEGDCIGIVGKNGAGKSTMLKILSRITEPTEGRVRIKGRVASLLEVGTGFHPELTGRENIFLNGAILGMSKHEIQRRLSEIIEFAEIERFIDTPVKRYSSGMYVRLAFSVAAHVEPEIMIVDEVLAVGDYRFQQKCLGKVGEMGQSGRTVLFVSHNLGVINNICNKCVLLENGRLVMSGGASEVIERYLHGSGEQKGVIKFEPSRDLACSISRLAVVENETGRAIESLPFQAPFGIEIDVHADQAMEALVGLAILNSSGEVVTTLHSVEIGEDESLSRNICLNPGTNRLAVRIIGNVLRPGTYYISASVFSRKLHQNYDSRESALSFTISDHGPDRYFDSRQQGQLFFNDLHWGRR